MQVLGQNTRSYKEVFPKRSSIRRNSSEPVRLEIQQQTRPYPVSAPPSPKVKTVRFDEGSLENVHYFLKSDKPLYIGSSASRVDIPYHYIASDGGALAIELSNFPSDTAARQAQLVRLENVWLSGNGDALLGSVSVANLDYHKHVICRFTWDDWRTISFVEARFDPSGSILNKPLEYDCFVFEIGLSHLAEIHSKIMRCCVQYTVNGLQLWDNNNASNYDVVFSKTLKHSLVYQTPGPLDANPHDALDTSNNCVSEHSRHFVTGVSARLYHPLMDIEMPTKGERLRQALYDRYSLTRNLIDAINQKPRGTMCQTAQNWSDRRIRASNAA